MWRVAIKDLLAHKLRSLLVVSIIMVGVAFVAGSMILTNTVTKTFDDIFGDAFESVDLVVRGSGGIEGAEGFSPSDPVSEDLVGRLQQVEGAGVVEGYLEGFSQLLDKDGETLAGAGFAPEFGSNWIEGGTTNAFELREGRAPRADDEIVIDAGLADIGEYAVGDRARVLGSAETREYEIVGIAGFGNANSPGGTRWIFYTTPQAQEVLGLPGQYSEVYVNPDEGTSVDELRERVSLTLGSDFEVLTGQERADELQEPIGEGFAFVNILLLVFASISLFVGAFVINNVFTILIAQRIKQLAMLRAIGAKRSRVLSSVLLEGFVIGVIASILGLVVGLGIATGLIVLINMFGVGNGEVSPVIDVSTVVTALIAGTVITVAASLVPAVKAARVPPLAAMRDVAFEKTNISVVRLVFGVLLGILGVALLVWGIAESTLRIVGVGSGIVFLAVALLAATFARPVIRVLGWPVAKLRGVPGSLARENAMRSPRRTSATAAALMISVTLVTLFTIIFGSIQASVNDQIDRTFTGDLIVQGPQSGIGGLPTDLAPKLEALPETGAVAKTRLVTIDAAGDPVFASAVNAASYAEIFRIDSVDGDFRELDATGVAISRTVAENKGLSVGDSVPIGFSAGDRVDLRVVSVFEGDEFSGGWYISIDTYDQYVAQKFDAGIALVAAPGTDIDELTRAVESIVDTYPNAQLLDLASVKEQVNSQIGIALNILYSLLGLAVIVSLIGIGTTLSLAVLERTREIGLLRAVGMTRSKVRAAIRWESVFVAVFGTFLGMALGTGFALAILETLREDGINVISVPMAPLVTIVAIAIVAGVVAGLWPAFRASRLNILKAISIE